MSTWSSRARARRWMRRTASRFRGFLLGSMPSAVVSSSTNSARSCRGRAIASPAPRTAPVRAPAGGRRHARNARAPAPRSAERFAEALDRDHRLVEGAAVPGLVEGEGTLEEGADGGQVDGELVGRQRDGRAPRRRGPVEQRQVVLAGGRERRPPGHAAAGGRCRGPRFEGSQAVPLAPQRELEGALPAASPVRGRSRRGRRRRSARRRRHTA